MSISFIIFWLVIQLFKDTYNLGTKKVQKGIKQEVNNIPF